jgi:uncharacterized protein YndB with AHSA1/START domain
MATRLSTTAQPGERELVITRIFDAPRELVYGTQSIDRLEAYVALL